MRKSKILLAMSVLIFGLCGCASINQEAIKKEVSVVETFEVDKDTDMGNKRILSTYYKMSDGSWKTNEQIYQYKLDISGKLNNSEKTMIYTILSNKDDVTFEEAWKASGLSSNTGDYFKPEDAVIVAIQME